ncbi:hypothetical protein BJY01DRAFT_254221 [Aspergillus pseudoustus]|uniref:Glucose-methanol-choline oxidoreductase N-terminal domain-containing protein n=1 Tax=Aspergillus pseudoustus TaxID=1810923 RepID=A0ABR4IV17_9EURO
MSAPQEFSADFINVGGGTTGCLVASQLAREFRDKTVLLIEVGKDTRGLPVRSPEHHYMISFLFPELDHGYITVPQTALKNRELPYLWGRGLGGTSVINFMAYHYGSSTEYDRWANLVGDEAWRWEILETYHGIQEGHGRAGYVTLRRDSRHYNMARPIHTSLPTAAAWETNLVVDSMRELEVQSPLSAWVMPLKLSSMHSTSISTRRYCLSHNLPPSLDILYNTWVTKLELDGKRAAGVTLSDGRFVRASQEVILCAGAIDSPRLLLLSGIGDTDELSAVGVQVRHNLSGVGKNLHDHEGVGIMHQMTTAYLEKQRSMDSELNASLRCDSMAVTYTKLNGLFASKEFRALDSQAQDHMRLESVLNLQDPALISHRT